MVDGNSTFSEFVDWAFKTIILGGFAAMWRSFTMLTNKVNKNSDDLYDFKTEVAKTYAEKPVIERVHLRLDEMGNKLDSIKTLLITNFRNNHDKSN